MIDKDIIKDEVSDRRNYHRNHREFRLPFGTDYIVAHHAERQKRNPVKYNAIIDFCRFKNVALSTKSGNEFIDENQTKNHHCGS